MATSNDGPLSRRNALGMMARVGAAVGITSSFGPSMAASDFPSRTIRLVVPFAPGGSTDILGRLLARHLFSDAGQPSVVENKPGAGGNIGARLVALAPADGYTLEIGAMSTHAINGSLYKALPFDPMGDFEAIAMLAYAINVVAVSNKVPAKTFPELLAYIRANPGKVTYASGGIGTHNHLTLALLAKKAGLDIVHVPYKGGGPAVMALMQGECDFYSGGASLLLPHAKTGKIRILAVTESAPTDLLPGVPSVSETIKDFEVTNWYGVFGPKGMEGSLKTRINEEVNRITALPDVSERLTAMGMVREPASPTRLQEILKADYQLWSSTIESMGIKAE